MEKTKVNRKVGEVFRKHHGDPLERKTKEKKLVSERLVYGEFYLEEMWYVKTAYNIFGQVNQVVDSRVNDYERMHEENSHVWKIHISMLPPVNETIQMEWMFK